MRIFAVIAIAILMAVHTPASAQYGSPTEDDNRTQRLIDELKGLIDKGESERLADPWYLRDLRGLVQRYDWPWRRLLFFDDFLGPGPAAGSALEGHGGRFPNRRALWHALGRKAGGATKYGRTGAGKGRRGARGAVRRHPQTDSRQEAEEASGNRRYVGSPLRHGPRPYRHHETPSPSSSNSPAA